MLLGRHRLPTLGCPSLAAQHPAFLAWRQVCSASPEPNSIEVLQEVRKGRFDSGIYRLAGVGPRGTSIIAKRCPTVCAEVEHTVYTYVLRHLPISTVGFYGYLQETQPEYGWLFLEYVDDEQFSDLSRHHRKLAARWVGQMHVLVAGTPTLSMLPDRGPKHYLSHLLLARHAIQSNVGNFSLESPDLRVADAILFQEDLLQSRWDQVEEVCSRIPRTLVHGDFARYNLRVRTT